MRKIAVVTDSASDIPAELAEKYGITILPFTITVDDKSYVERQDFTCEEYYEMLTTCANIPSTAHITMMCFFEHFCAWDDAGYSDVLYVSINAGGSNTFDAAHMGAAQFAEERPASKMKIHIVDSHAYSMIYGWPVCEAARKLQNGAELSDILLYLEEEFARNEAVLSMFTLRFVKKSGRISAAAAFAGELLGLRPIISLIDGETVTVSKARGDVNVMPAMVAYLKKRLAQGGHYLVCGTDSENIKMLAKLCKKEVGEAPLLTFPLGAAIATNTGPDAVAIIFTGAARR